MMFEKKGQVWVETVIYTLIGLALIGVVLGIVTPKISSQSDRILVEQTIDSMNIFDEKMNEVIESVPGNVRKIPSFSMKKGEFYIDASNDQIIFVLRDLSRPFSEPGVPIRFGNIILVSEEDKRLNSVSLTLDYSNITDITYDESDESKKFSVSATPYRFSIEKKEGAVDIREIS